MYLHKFIQSNDIRKRYELNVFVHCAEIIPAKFDALGKVSNPQEAGKMFARHGYFLSNSLMLSEGLPSALTALRYAIPNLHITLYAVSNQMLGYDKNGIAGYHNPVRLLTHKPIQKTACINRFYPEFNELPNYIDIEAHWDIKHVNGFIPLNSRSLVYSATFRGSIQHTRYCTNVLSKAELQNARVIESPKYMTGIYLGSLDFNNAKDLVRKYAPQFYPEHINTDDFEKAKKFLLKHHHIVLKTPHLVSGDEIHFFNINKKSKNEKAEILKRFKTEFERLLRITLEFGFPSLIVQKFLDGIVEHGETRIIIMDGKILPVGVNMYGQPEDKVFKPEKGAKSRDVILDEGFLKVAKEFIESVHDKVDLYYYGLDVIKQTLPNKTEKYYILEANYGTVGFFPRIATTLKKRIDEIKSQSALLPVDIQNMLCLDILDILIYKPIYEQFFKNKKQNHLMYIDKNTYGPPINELMLSYLKNKKIIRDNFEKERERRHHILINLQKAMSDELEASFGEVEVASEKLISAKENIDYVEYDDCKKLTKKKVRKNGR